MDEALRIESLEHYIHVIKSLNEKYEWNNHKHTRFLYRGHSKSEFKLLPGLYRDRSDTCESLYSGDDLTILRLFKKYASSIMPNPPVKMLNWAEYAQHYGVPTRFLDWSDNCLVALFFACNNDPNEDGNVWCLDYGCYDSLCGKNLDESLKITREELINMLFEKTITCETDAEIKYPLLYTPYYFDERMSAQGSYFLVWGTDSRPLDEIISNDSCEMDTKKLCKSKCWIYGSSLEKPLSCFTIPQKAKVSLIRDLDNLGINERTLFPGLDGLGHYINWRFRNDEDNPLI